jgi:hypothetical protein
MLSMEKVAHFQISLPLGCGVALELPVVLGLLGWLGVMSACGMWRFNKYALERQLPGGVRARATCGMMRLAWAQSWLSPCRP